MPGGSILLLKSSVFARLLLPAMVRLPCIHTPPRRRHACSQQTQAYSEFQGNIKDKLSAKLKFWKKQKTKSGVMGQMSTITEIASHLAPGFDVPLSLFPAISEQAVSE